MSLGTIASIGLYGDRHLRMLQYDWLVREKIADGALISKWRKPGYEILCSLLAIQKNNHNFGTTSHCRCAGPATLMSSARSVKGAA